MLDKNVLKISKKNNICLFRPTEGNYTGSVSIALGMFKEIIKS